MIGMETRAWVEHQNTMRRIEDNILKGLAIRETFLAKADMHDEIAKAINDTKFVHIHELMGGSLQTELLLCVTRAWDKSPGAQSISNLFKQIDWEQVRTDITGKEWETERLNAIEELGDLITEIEGQAAHKALLVSRAEGIAHSIVESFERKKMEEPRGANLGELYGALDYSVEGYNKLDLALRSSTTHFDHWSGEYRKAADVYFKHTITYDKTR